MTSDLKVGETYTTTVEATVAYEADVVIAGGGTAGIVAAIAAARNGADVLLVERRGFLGGMMTAGNAGLTKYIVHEKTAEEYREVLTQLATNPGAVQVIGGIPMEITKRLIKEGAALGTDGTAGSYVFTAQEEFKWLLLTMMEEAGVRLLLHSLIVDVVKEGDSVRGIVVENKSGRQILLTRMVVDATGDGDVAAKAGEHFVVGVGPDDLGAKHGTPLGTLQNMGMMFRMGNVNLERCLEYLKEHPDQFVMQSCAMLGLDEAYEAFRKGDMMTILVGGIGHRFQIYNSPLPGVITCCCPSFNGSGLSVEDLTQGEIALAKELQKRVADMKTHLPGFEDAFLLDAPEIGVRETRHVHGEYILGIEDVFSTQEFPDTIGRGCHPIDISPIPEELQKHPLPPRWYFNIPYRSLVAKITDNLLLAGRCISSTREAAGCTRPTVQCMVTGEAAGVAAAMCLVDDVKPRDLNTDLLRRKLTDQEVIL